jgi:hypothetical protein
VFVCSEDGDGSALFETHGGMPRAIMKALTCEFGQEIVDEGDPGFWGETWEELLRKARLAKNS